MHLQNLAGNVDAQRGQESPMPETGTGSGSKHGISNAKVHES
jgi:hypothetical protein